MESYLVTIVGSAERDPLKVAGVVRENATGRELTFGSLGELWTILNPMPSFPGRRVDSVSSEEAV